MRLPLFLFASLCLWAAFGAWPASAQQQGVQRCTAMSGDTVYTDKNCEDIGAMDRLPSASSSSLPATGALYRGGCSRTLSDLVAQMSMAISAGDVNRLAGVYHWSGVSDAAALRILNQLDAVVQRPLVDIAPIRPDPAPVIDAEGAVVDANQDGYYPTTAQRSRPVGLRVMQTLKNSATPSNTTFGLRRAYNCFWITL
ncbi:hypothetical protein [Pseudoxanthomonas sp. Root630]|uniref:hypothetical protein n=1 Tax=Pseudoxanthomonas sp. Root630 TaxID=1736574 RepID=UPI000702FDBF|nr:hypothetical protein [Pseudoxanthomonas sp. Root630]KRA46707.1 hypothetical protein ASD72_05850 [Pseudoxanthomonas sp. Root630]